MVLDKLREICYINNATGAAWLFCYGRGHAGHAHL